MIYINTFVVVYKSLILIIKLILFYYDHWWGLH